MDFQSGAQLVSQNTDQNLSSYLDRLVFRHLTDEERVNLRNQYNLNPNEGWWSNCDWIEDFIEDEDAWWLIRNDNVCLGAVYMFREDININRIPTWYISIECAFNNVNSHPTLTSGKLLWMFILRQIYNEAHGPFIVWMHAIPSAVNYHTGMGLLPYHMAFNLPPRAHFDFFLNYTNLIEKFNLNTDLVNFLH